MSAGTVLNVVFGTWGLIILACSILPYLVWHFYLSLFTSPRNLKDVYEAEWAVVTGSSTGALGFCQAHLDVLHAMPLIHSQKLHSRRLARHCRIVALNSSIVGGTVHARALTCAARGPGIGKAVAQRCADQGLNVVLVARPDAYLDTTHRELQKCYPELQFRKVAVDLSSRGYVDVVAEATEDILCQVCFLNAGYVKTGFFNRVELAAHYANLECNVGHCIGLTHLFLNRILEAKARGCFVFTSSAAAVMPGPFVSLYNSTKSFLSAFGSSLAAEVKCQGIDVMVFHPSPVASRFASSLDHQIDALDFFNKFAVRPERLPDIMFASVGRCVWRDSGGIALLFRMTSKLIDYNAFASLTAAVAHTMPDFKRHWNAAQ